MPLLCLQEPLVYQPRYHLYCVRAVYGGFQGRAQSCACLPCLPASHTLTPCSPLLLQSRSKSTTHWQACASSTLQMRGL